MELREFGKLVGIGLELFLERCREEFRFGLGARHVGFGVLRAFPCNQDTSRKQSSWCFFFGLVVVEKLLEDDLLRCGCGRLRGKTFFRRFG